MADERKLRNLELAVGDLHRRLVKMEAALESRAAGSVLLRAGVQHDPPNPMGESSGMLDRLAAPARDAAPSPELPGIPAEVCEMAAFLSTHRALSHVSSPAILEACISWWSRRPAPAPIDAFRLWNELRAQHIVSASVTAKDITRALAAVEQAPPPSPASSPEPVHTLNCTIQNGKDMGFCLDCAAERANERKRREVAPVPVAEPSLPVRAYATPEELFGPKPAAPVAGEWRVEGKTHDLKTWPQQFAMVKRGTKTFEYRKDDRAFSVGDCLLLREWDPETKAYSGDSVKVDVTSIMWGDDKNPFGVPEGYCVMSIRRPALRAQASAPPSSGEVAFRDCEPGEEPTVIRLPGGMWQAFHRFVGAMAFTSPVAQRSREDAIASVTGLGSHVTPIRLIIPAQASAPAPDGGEVRWVPGEWAWRTSDGKWQAASMSSGAVWCSIPAATAERAIEHARNNGTPVRPAFGGGE